MATPGACPSMLLILLAAFIFSPARGALPAARTCAEIPPHTYYLPARHLSLGAVVNPLFPMAAAPRRFWLDSEIKRSTAVVKTSNSKFASTTSLSSETVADLLEVDAETKAELLAGHVSPRGAATALTAPADDATVVVIDVVHRVTTATHRLKEELVQHSVESSPHYNLPQAMAVTQLVYGVEAAVRLELERREGETEEDILAQLNDALDAVSLLVSDSDASVTDEAMSFIARCAVTFFADFGFLRFPSSPAAKLRAMADLQTTLQQVAATPSAPQPLFATVEPLCKWQPSAAPVMLFSVDERHVDELAIAMERLRAQRTAFDELHASVDRAIGFQKTADQLKTLVAAADSVLDDMASALSAVLPEIRSGTKEQSALQTIAAQLAASPFNDAAMRQLLHHKTGEAAFLRSHVDAFPTQVRRASSMTEALAPASSTARLNAAAVLVLVKGEDDADRFIEAALEYAETPSSGFPTSFSSAEWYVQPAAYASSLEWFRDVVARRQCIMVPESFTCQPELQQLVLLDYTQNQDAVDRVLEGTAVGRLTQPTVLFFHRSPSSFELELVSASMQRCLTDCDTRDAQGDCLYEPGTVPDGCSCGGFEGTDEAFRDSICLSGKCSSDTQTCGSFCEALELHCDAACLEELRLEAVDAERALANVDTTINTLLDEELAQHKTNLRNITSLFTDITVYQAGQYDCASRLGSGYVSALLESGLNGNTNQGSGGRDQYMCGVARGTATPDDDNAKFLVEITTMGSKGCPRPDTDEHWMAYFGTTARVDLNAGAGGKDRFVCLEVMTMAQIRQTKRWPIRSLYLRRTTTPFPPYRMAHVAYGNGDLNEDSGGADIFLFYARTTELPREIERFERAKAALEQRRIDDRARLQVIADQLRKEYNDTLANKDDGVCPAGTEPNPNTAQSTSCPCIYLPQCSDDTCTQRGFSSEGSRCINEQNGGFRCGCRPGWTGSTCASRVDPCAACSADEFCVRDGTLGLCLPRAVCRPGQFLVSNGDATTDRACMACPAGTYQPSYDYRGSACRPHTVTACACGERMERRPTEFQDGSCTPCPAGMYVAQDNHTETTCAPQLYCSIQVEEPVAPGSCADLDCPIQPSQDPRSNTSGGGGGGGGSNVGAIAGGVVGGVVLILLILLVLLLLRRRKRHDKLQLEAIDGYANPVYGSAPVEESSGRRPIANAAYSEVSDKDLYGEPDSNV